MKRQQHAGTHVWTCGKLSCTCACAKSGRLNPRARRLGEGRFDKLAVPLGAWDRCLRPCRTKSLLEIIYHRLNACSNFLYIVFSCLPVATKQPLASRPRDTGPRKLSSRTNFSTRSLVGRGSPAHARFSLSMGMPQPTLCPGKLEAGATAGRLRLQRPKEQWPQQLQLPEQRRLRQEHQCRPKTGRGQKGRSHRRSHRLQDANPILGEGCC